MTEFLKKFSLLLFIPPVITLVYDLIDGWFVHAKFELRKLSKWWEVAGLSVDSANSVKHIVAAVTSNPVADKMFNAPAAFVLFGPPLFFFLLYRILFLLQGGKVGGYKSRH